MSLSYNFGTGILASHGLLLAGISVNCFRDPKGMTMLEMAPSHPVGWDPHFSNIQYYTVRCIGVFLASISASLFQSAAAKSTKARRNAALPALVETFGLFCLQLYNIKQGDDATSFINQAFHKTAAMSFGIFFLADFCSAYVLSKNNDTDKKKTQ
jgi:hypothetical protein